jgi:hypothetical protein
VVRLLAVIGFLSAWLALFTGAAYASDCPPDDPSRSDCKSAATTARNPLVPIAGAILGGAAGQVIGQALSGGSKGETAGDDGDQGEGKDGNAEPENPCLEALESFQLAKLEQEALFEAYLSWQSTVTSLDELYWKTSKAGYWSGVVDVGFLAGSVFGRPLAGISEALGKKYLNDTLKQKLLEAALKSMLKGSLKDLNKYFDPAKLPMKQAEDVGKKYLQEVLKNEITTRVMQGYLDQGLRAGGFDGATAKLFGRMEAYDKIRGVVSKAYAEPWANFLGDSLSLYSAGMDALTTREQLEIIRMRLNAARDNLHNSERLLDEVTDRVSLARDSFNRCTESELYQRYLRRLEFLKLPSQG